MVDRAAKTNVVKAKASAAAMAGRPFQCTWHEGCPKSFNRKSDLQRHYRIHTNERPYACDYKPCEKTFIQRSALTVHRRTHTGDKPHKCPFNGCGKCFSDSSSLARHRRIHTNDKPYICRNQNCRKAFCRKTTMTKHFRKEHATDSAEEAEYSEAESSEDEAEEQDTEASNEGYEVLQNRRDTPTSQRASNYNADLWRLPAQTAQRPRPLQLQRTFDAHPSPHIVKIERSMSRTPQRSATDPQANSQTDRSEYLHLRTNTMSDRVSVPSNVAQRLSDGALPQQFRLEDSGLWHTNQSMQDSPTSLTNSSSGLDQPPVSFQSPQYQPQGVSQEPIRYAQHQESTTQMPVHQPVLEIRLDDQPQHHYNNMGHGQGQHFTSMPQNIIQQNQYRAEIPQQYQDVPPTPVPTQQIQHYSLGPTTQYSEPQFIPTESYPIGNRYLPSQIENISYPEIDWFKEIKPESEWQTPTERLDQMGWHS